MQLKSNVYNKYIYKRNNIFYKSDTILKKKQCLKKQNPRVLTDQKNQESLEHWEKQNLSQWIVSIQIIISAFGYP